MPLWGPSLGGESSKTTRRAKPRHDSRKVKPTDLGAESCSRLLHLGVGYLTLFEEGGASFSLSATLTDSEGMSSSGDPTRRAADGDFEPNEGWLRGENFEAGFGAIQYAYPAVTTGDDAQWVRGWIDVRLTGAWRLVARAEVTFWAPDLESFSREISSLFESLSGEAVLRHLEGEFELRVGLDRGRGSISGFVRDPLGPRLEFRDIETDQTYLFSAVAGISRIVDSFPPR
jgi:hypothetical protein